MFPEIPKEELLKLAQLEDLTGKLQKVKEMATPGEPTPGIEEPTKQESGPKAPIIPTKSVKEAGEELETK